MVFRIKLTELLKGTDCKPVPLSFTEYKSYTKLYGTHIRKLGN